MLLFYVEKVGRLLHILSVQKLVKTKSGAPDQV